MAHARKATRNAVGGELSEWQVEAEFTRIRDGPQRIKQAATLRTIKQYFEADDIEVTSMKVSLTCPISKTRVKVPVRSVNCHHLECFDLRSYLNYHQLLTFWECPFSCCKAQARCDKLRVDEYICEVLRATDDSVQEVEVFADGSFKAVQRAAPTEMATIDDDEPYVPSSGTDPTVKTESNEESLVEPMHTDAFPTDQDQPQALSLAAGDDEELRAALRESRQQIAALRCELDSAMNRAVNAESVASKVRDENYRLSEELAAKNNEIRELTTKNGELQARLDAVHKLTETNHPMTHAETMSIDQGAHEPSSSLAAGDADAAATDSRPSAQGNPQLEHDDCSASDASMSLDGLSHAPAMESDSDCEEPPNHAPEQRKKQQKGRFACTVCGRRFYKSSALSQHQRTHSGLKPYQCAQCHKDFNRHSSLRTHEQMHAGVKPYPCGQCGKAFGESSKLRKHMRIHAGDKPYKCGQCGRAFNRSDNLRKHERTHSGVKPYKCGQCDRRPITLPVGGLKRAAVYSGPEAFLGPSLFYSNDVSLLFLVLLSCVFGQLPVICV
ncbi:endothelial zinc finger protein induced by tumor necrosis factor alpha [Aphelenchoides avenae]|nr:endothelial zinc finger protein induced by tumor necrosis factor alpha [Aphelenchus avenae]